jgi:methionine synthase / methylenetetrahydrofolate reductase(NADPH)
MTRTVEFLDALRSRILVCDGAVGTMLHAQGHSFNASLAFLNISNPQLVGAIHESYVSAGVDIVQTNTFGASLRAHATKPNWR